MGVGVVFLSDNIDTRDNDGELRLTIMASMAQEESRKTSQRVKWGQRRRMEAGVVFGSDSTYGFETRGGALTVRPAEAEVVRLIYHKYLAEGKGAHVIARELGPGGDRAAQSGALVGEHHPPHAPQREVRGRSAPEEVHHPGLPDPPEGGEPGQGGTDLSPKPPSGHRGPGDLGGRPAGSWPGGAESGRGESGTPPATGPPAG